MTELPDTHRLVELADAFEKLRGPRPDPQEADHRRALERIVLRFSGASLAFLLLVSSWIAVDPLGRYERDHRQQGLQALGGIAAALVGAVAGYSARRP